MVALGTTDVSMSSMASEKTMFLGAFTKQARDMILDTILDKMNEDNEEGEDFVDEEIEMDSDRPARRRKDPAKISKLKVIEDLVEAQDDEPLTSKGKRKLRAKSKKQGDVIEGRDEQLLPTPRPIRPKKSKTKASVEVIVVVDDVGSSVTTSSPHKGKAKRQEDFVSVIVEVGRSHLVTCWLVCQGPQRGPSMWGAITS